MMTDTFAPPQPPSIGKMPETVTPRVLKSGFGDGYRQDAGDGLNTLARVMDPTWDVLTSAQIDTVVAFFEERRGYIAFFWTPPGQSVERKWVARSWTRNPSTANNSGNAETLTAHFEQVFDL